MIRRLQKNNKVLCTTRNYREVNDLAKLRKIKLLTIGKHGGQTRIGKLDASLNRMSKLSDQIQKFNPDIAISFCSPEASRIAFGFGIRHIAFCDSPHADAVMRLSIPLVQKLFIPWIIPKREFSRYGINEENIIPYKAVDAAIIVKYKWKEKKKLRKDRKNILIRVEEEQAAYVEKNQWRIRKIIQKISDEFSDHNIMILPRYESQIAELKRSGYKINILDKVIVGRELLRNVDVFIGSGGTMTAESSLLGIPTISYNAVPNLVQDYLVKEKLIVLESNPDRIVLLVRKMLSSDNKLLQKNARRVLLSMEDPYKKLVQIIKTE